MYAILLAILIQLAAVGDITPVPQEWAMSIEVCARFDPKVEDALKRGVVVNLRRQCRWLVLSQAGVNGEPILIVWPTEDECLNAPVPISEKFFERKRNCQQLPPLD